MEAVPKLPLLSFDLKVSPENTHFGPKLKQYIAEAYKEDPDSYNNEIHQLEGLRSAAVRATSDAAGLSALVRYFCQLRAMQSRFPMTKGAPAACTFTWKDLYANLNYSLVDIKFEMACILYNIGVLHTQLGSAEPRTTADSLKSACQHYQYAAWAFQFLREQNPLPSGADICTEILILFQEICFAQAQECILDKSIQDTRKPSVIGAVATQVLYFYKNSLAHLGPSGASDTVHEVVGTKIYNTWFRYISFKMAYIGCIVCLYQGINAEEQQKMGERVAFYQQAVDKLAEARKLAKYIEPVQVTQEALTFTNDVVEGKRKAAKNENEFIYHEEVPEKDMLSDLKPVCLVSAVAINFNDPEVSGPDIFGRLVPMGAHEASSMYSEEKAKLLRHVVSQTEAKNTELTEFMSSLQLDQLDVLDSDQKIPQEIVDRCAAMNAKAEIIQNLVDSMNSLAEIISDVEHSLEEIKSLIQEETLKEKEYQKQMGPRPPSIVQTEISREYHKYQEAHSRTNESNQVLHKAMTLHITNLRLLSQPLEVLQTKIPSIENIEGLDRDTMKEMRRVVGKAREMQKQRDSLVQQLRTALADDDVTAQLLARSNEPAEDIFKQEIEKHTPSVKIIEQNLAAQENIINKLTSLYASYGDSRRLLSDVLRKREGLINALITSYDTHAELLGKSQKGLEFYRKLSHNVNGLLTRVRSVCQVQREERAQLMATQKAPTPVTPAASKPNETAPAPAPVGTGLKLKDYLPYMKNRTMQRNTPPLQGQMEHLPNEAYYPETIYPTSIRPTPVGSEATDITQPNLPDGVVLPHGMQNVPNTYARYAQGYAPSDNDHYTPPANYAYPVHKFIKPEDHYSYTSYTPPQYSSQMPEPQTYTNPYYSATNNNSTAVTDSQNSTPYSNDNQTNISPNPNQYNVQNNSYMTNQAPATPDSNMAQYTPTSQDFYASFAQMQISASKNEPVLNYGGEYGQTQFSVQYPQSYTPNMATYSHAGQNSNTNIVGSPMPADNNYGYTSDPLAQYGQTSMPNVSNPMAQYGQTSMPNVSNPMAQYGQTSMPNVSNPITQYAQTALPNSTAQNNQNSISTVTNPAAQYDQTVMPNVSNPTSQYGQISVSNISHPTAQYGQTVMPNTSNPMAQYDQASLPNESMAQYAQTAMPNMQNPTSQFDQTSVQNVSNSMAHYGQASFQNDPATNSFNPQASNQLSNFPNSMQNVPTSTNQTSSMSNQHNISSSNPIQYSMSNTSISATQDPNQMQHIPMSVPNSAQSFSNTMQAGHMSGPHTLNPTSSMSNVVPNFSNPMQAVPNSIPNASSAIPTISGYGVDQQYAFTSAYESISQGYVYTNAESTVTSTANASLTTFSTGQPYCLPNEATGYIDQSLAQLDALDKPIKSHVTGEALSTGIRHQNYTPMGQLPEQSYQPTSAQYQDQSNSGHGQNYQNHPGYTFNATSGNYDYNYGSQNSYTNYGQQNVDQQSVPQDPNWNAAGVYTNAGPCQTVQSPSENPQSTNTGPPEEASNSQIYYNLPYGYLTVTNQANDIQSQPVQVTTNYGANVNCSTYMQSGQVHDTSVTFTSNQVPTVKENVADLSPKPTEAEIHPTPVESTPKETTENQPVENKVEEPKPEPTTFDLLSEIDFTVEHKPLMPEIKVPQISEKSIFKPSAMPKVEPIVRPVPKEDPIERPAKRDLFSDPSLMNSFTQDVKNLHRLTDTLTNKTPSGLTVLDSKWKSFQDTQAKENMTRSKSVAMRSSKNIVTEVVPYDDSRLSLKSDPDAYINASYYKQLASWCIPIVISKCPEEQEYTIFWKAMLENKITCIVCLLSEIEMSGNAYWPTAKGQSIDLADGLRVTLEDVTCNVHWTERKLSITFGKSVFMVTHYQINVFPAKIVCPPLVLLADKILSVTYEGRLSNQLCGVCIQCGAGAGRSSVLALLVLVMCQVRAGYWDLCDMLDAGCVNLYKHRTNVLEDTKYLADAYRTALFYAQGVLCSGTTMFNGEAVSVASGASVLPPVTPSPAVATTTGSTHPTLKSKFSRESFEEMRQAPGLKSGDMKDPLNFLDPLWSLKKK